MRLNSALNTYTGQTQLHKRSRQKKGQVQSKLEKQPDGSLVLKSSTNTKREEKEETKARPQTAMNIVDDYELKAIKKNTRNINIEGSKAGKPIMKTDKNKEINDSRERWRKKNHRTKSDQRGRIPSSGSQNETSRNYNETFDLQPKANPQISNINSTSQQSFKATTIAKYNNKKEQREFQNNAIKAVKGEELIKRVKSKKSRESNHHSKEEIFDVLTEREQRLNMSKSRQQQKSQQNT